MRKIERKIVGCEVITPSPSRDGPLPEPAARPEALWGTTYKIKTPQLEHALYVTINDLVPDENGGRRRPYEIFINSRNMEHYQWVVALTLLISAVFRRGGDIRFIVDELRAVFAPQGGYFRPGGRYMPSLVAEIADVIERHLAAITPATEHTGDTTGFPAGARLCRKCLTRAAVLVDGCLTCLNCGDSRCG
ncbi:TSCPD domain-containing protein [Zobellella iuensis]|uniref:ribonucleoside-diphosphate reductase n=1 Tax=Zobellella iuensis TaxID=2803811 RepID=A0ABS1QXB2_9GAMM|nr:NrdJb [Zobellella iuensis]MBL1379096.1 NrdJb [Zobellella iuensis]